MAIAISDYNKIVGTDERIKSAHARNTLTYTTIETICKGITFNQMFHQVSAAQDNATHIAVSPVPMTSQIKSIKISYASTNGAYRQDGKSGATGQANNARIYTVSAYVLPGVDVISSVEQFTQLRTQYATAATEAGAMNLSGIVLVQDEPITVFARGTILTLAGNNASIAAPIEICPMQSGLVMATNTLRQQVLRLYRAQNGQWSAEPVFGHAHNCVVPNAYLRNGLWEKVKKADTGMICLQIKSSGAAEAVFNTQANQGVCPVVAIEYIKGTNQSATPSYPGFTSVEAY